jgi:hypothetical protein
MKWNLRLAAANRGIWKASELQRVLAEHGLIVSAGKMSGLWSGEPASIKLDDLNIGVLAFLLGKFNHLFLTCADLDISGNNTPPGCTYGPPFHLL